MKTQSYKNHSRLLPSYHYFLFTLVTAVFVGSLINLFNKCCCCQSSCHAAPADFNSALLIAGLASSVYVIYFMMRSFALRAQDRAIRAEENFRHYIITGKPHDARLTIRQIIALRFASDEEFVALAQRAAQEGTTPKDIKKAIQNWKGDFDRA